MKLLRKILFPFSVLYGGVTALRNFFYNHNLLKSKSYDIPVVSVGNLSTGGTGKSPMIEFLIGFLRKDFKVAVLSRGYKRKTSGFRLVEENSTVSEVGDEPLQFKQKFPKITVAVCEDRRTGIEKLKEKAEIILLDDAFQHRKVKPSTQILLTPYDDLYYNDSMLPTGNLREFASGAKRANIIIVTKCPDGVAYAEMQKIQLKLNLQEKQKLYFSRIGYDKLIYGPTETQRLDYLLDKSFTLVTGIANPKPLVDFLRKEHYVFDHKTFPDHHHFTASEINKLKESEIILTTEKDYVRLQPALGKFAIYYLPIKTIILKEQEHFLKQSVLDSIDEARFS
ncbi:tetraacyldisaccharide 4'-kinase [Ulvibacter antarcticus]|uniref:Tetraacyldisaccharide 4'-kinase n=1 Tax=Ulvibacter antarcticus TaxID=442714 RepID=A0A3L9YTJ9_9FLAO|nr:tetraacyldisaccharide 4'-kinase [Ulvibacter antarcticus]RMA57812.1 lipid-A-disaccharide kinase [Ulvibacter antarcticus]